ncbi:MAG: hypothetical protein ACFB10_20640 [Salibacteraceae bacterium]
MSRIVVLLFCGLLGASHAFGQGGKPLPSPLIPGKSVIKLSAVHNPAVVVFENADYRVFLHFDSYCAHLEEEINRQGFPDTGQLFEQWKVEIRSHTAAGDTLNLLEIPLVYDGFWMENTLEDALMVQQLLSKGYASVYNKNRNRFEKKLVIRTKEKADAGQQAIEISYRLSGGKSLFANHYPI